MQEHREDLLLADEKGAGGFKERETHAPEVACDAGAVSNAALPDQAYVAGGGGESDGGQEKVNWGWIAPKMAGGAFHCHDAEGHGADGTEEGGKNGNFFEETDCAGFSPDGHPSGGDEIEGEDAAEECARLELDR